RASRQRLVPEGNHRMPVPCFTRTENNGMYVIFPLKGKMKHDCMIVNETVKWVYDRLQDNVGLDELVPSFTSRASELKRVREFPTDSNGSGGNGGNGHVVLPSNAQADAEKAKFDLYRILLSLRDRDICDYTYDQLLTLLPGGRVLKGTTQV